MSSAPPPFPEELNGDETLYRALRNASHLADKRFAFLLRPLERESGLSVRYNCTPDDCENELAEKSYGVLSLLARQVVSLRLQVKPDSSNHANIIGLPLKEENETRAFSLAGELSRMAITVRSGLRKKTG
jgi:hypothetical protein